MSDNTLSEVTATRVRIVNQAGVQLFDIGSCDHGFPRFEMFNPNDECARVVIEADDNGTRISILSENGVSLLGLGASEKNGGGINLMLKDGSKAVTINADCGEASPVQVIEI